MMFACYASTAPRLHPEKYYVFQVEDNHILSGSVVYFEKIDHGWNVRLIDNIPGPIWTNSHSTIESMFGAFSPQVYEIYEGCQII